jgi:hypothetical protein
MSIAKEKLESFERTGNYVFHGSPDGNIEVLEPRQGNHVPDLSRPTDTVADGRPAVSATPFLDFAIFRAIINSKNVNIKGTWTSGFGIEEEGRKSFRVSEQDVLDQVRGKFGYVYVFDKKNFKPYTRGKGEGEGRPGSMEWRSYEKVLPIDTIEVTDEDIPSAEQIQIGNRE